MSRMGDELVDDSGSLMYAVFKRMEASPGSTASGATEAGLKSECEAQYSAILSRVSPELGFKRRLCYFCLDMMS